MDMFRDFRDVLWVVNTLALMVIGLVVWLRKPGDDALKAIERLESENGQMHEADRKLLATLEERIRHMPTSEELAELEGTVKAIDERTQGMGKQLDRIEGYLRNGGRA